MAADSSSDVWRWRAAATSGGNSVELRAAGQLMILLFLLLLNVVDTFN